jgi:uncharacterized membrane protein
MGTKRNEAHSKIAKLTTLAILVAVVILFQMMGSFIKIGPTSITLVLVPIVLGGILLGPVYGALLGLIFGAMTLWAGISGTDFFTNVLFTSQPFATSLICLGKAVAAGYGSGIIYKLISKKNNVVAIFAASAAAPIINTGLFILGGLFLVGDTLMANFSNFGVAEGTTLIYFIVIGCAGFNFIGELIANIALSPAVVTITNVVSKTLGKNK